MGPGYGSATASAGIFQPKMREGEKSYLRDQQSKKSGVDQKGAVSCCTTLAIVG